MSEAFLQCRRLVKRFGPVTAVAGADLTLPASRTLALLGPSGCGKTTLLRLIAGFEAPDEGEVRLGGRLLAGGGAFVPPDKRRVGLVFQDYALFPHLSVEANVAFGVPRGADRRRRVAELLELVGLAGYGDRLPHELSGGQQQRVALARTLAAQPDLLLLDEPFSNLDPALRARVRSEVWQLIRHLGVSAVFVTHEQEEALSLPDQVAIMLDGRILQVGRPQDVYRRPADRRVAAFLGDANFLPGRVRAGEVECELGRFPAPAAADGPAEVMVRPEHLRLSPETGLPAEVVEVDYHGHDQVVTVRLASGRLLRVRLLPSADLEPGQRVGVEPPRIVVVYPQQP